MAYRILEDESVQDGVRRIAHEQIDKAVEEVEDSDLDDHETVHQARKRCKKIRGLVRLVRPEFDAYSSENTWFRDAARKLSDIRDATTLLECFDALMGRYGDEIDTDAFAPVREPLLERREDVCDDKDADDRLEEFHDAMEDSHDRVDSWTLDEAGFDAIAGGLKKTYKRARKAMAKAYEEPTVESFHEWRKRVKYNRYHTRLLREVWRGVMKPTRDEVKHLSDLLGDDHDLAVLRATLLAEPDRFGKQRDIQALLALIDQRRKELQAWAHPLGERLYAEKPSDYVKRLGRAWQAWRAEQEIAAALSADSAKVYS